MRKNHQELASDSAEGPQYGTTHGMSAYPPSGSLGASCGEWKLAGMETLTSMGLSVLNPGKHVMLPSGESDHWSI